MANCIRPHRWGGYRRVGPGPVFARECRRRSCLAREVVTPTPQAMADLAMQGKAAFGPFVLTRTRHGQPYLHRITA